MQAFLTKGHNRRVRINARSILIGGSALVACVLVGLLFVVVWMSLRTPVGDAMHYSLMAYWDVYLDPFTYKVLFNTAQFSLVSVIVALLIAVPMAWAVEKTDLPGKSLVYVFMSIGVLLPSFLMAMGWTFVAHPRIGIVNQWLMELFGLETAPFNIGTITGMGFVQGLGLVPICFILVAPLYRAMDPALEEAAAVHGIGSVRTFFAVTAPLTFPGILAASIYIFIIAMAAFEVPAFLGLANKIYMFSTYIYLQANPHEELPRYDMIGATSMLMIGVALLLTWWYFRVLYKGHYRYAVVRGKAYRPRQFELGRKSLFVWVLIALYFLLSKVLPLALLIFISLLPYPQAFSLAALGQASMDHYRLLWGSEVTLHAAVNTGILMAVVPTICLVISFVISWVVVRSRLAGSYVFDIIAFLPHAVPHMVFAAGLAYIALFVFQQFVPIYGTLSIVIAMYVLVYISLATRGLNSALLQIHRELEEAAEVSGLPTARVILSILVPLLAPVLVNLWLWIALLSFRELTMASVLVKSTNVTLPMIIWGYWSGGRFNAAAALAVVSIACMAPLVALYWHFGRRAQKVSSA